MRYSEIITVPTCSPKESLTEGLDPTVPLFWSVDLPGLDRESMGDRAFETKLKAVVAWCRRYCPSFRDGKGLRDESGRLVGRTFEFGSEQEAALFRLWWA